MKLTSEDKAVMIFRNDKEYNGKPFATYSISVSSKDKEGKWVSGYLDCIFKKGVSVENKTKIIIKNAFPTVSQGKDRTFVKWMITDFEIEGQKSNDDFMNIPDSIEEEIPWS